VISGDFEVVVEYVIPIEGTGDERIMFEVLDREFDPGVRTVTHAY